MHVFTSVLHRVNCRSFTIVPKNWKMFPLQTPTQRLITHTGAAYHTSPSPSYKESHQYKEGIASYEARGTAKSYHRARLGVKWEEIRVNSRRFICGGGCCSRDKRSAAAVREI